MSLLRQMDVPVRSHLSQLSDDQVARLRARWEREKRARQEKPATAPATRRRRGVVAPPPPPPPAPEAADAGVPKRRRRKAADVAAAAEAQAAADAQAEADAAEAEATGVEVEPFAPPPPPDERRPEPFRELTPERTPAVEPRERYRRASRRRAAGRKRVRVADSDAIAISSDVRLRLVPSAPGRSGTAASETDRQRITLHHAAPDRLCRARRRHRSTATR